MASSTYVVQHACLRMRPLQIRLASVYVSSLRSLDKIVTVPPTIIRSCMWWVTHSLQRGPLYKTQPINVTDHRRLRHGLRSTPGIRKAQGQCTVKELNLHINIRVTGSAISFPGIPTHSAGEVPLCTHGLYHGDVLYKQARRHPTFCVRKH